MKACGRRVIPFLSDIGSVEYARSLVDTATSKLGGLDIVVNNAGFQMTHQSIEEIPEEEFERTLRTNVFGILYLSKAALQKMKPCGCIISTISIQTYEPSEQLVAYVATNVAIASLTKSIAKLAAEQGIRVNAVAPGPVWTPLIPTTMPEEKVETFGENSLFKRPVQPIDLAKVFVLLASADASYVTGEVYAATGGKTPL